MDHSDINYDNPVKLMLGNEPIQNPMLMWDPSTPLPSSSTTNSSKKNNNEPEQRPTKWGEEWEKTFNPPSFPAVARGVSLEDLEYLMRLYRLDELTKKKNLGQSEVADRDIRTPSPEPIFDKDGKRVNTAEQRSKDDMQSELHILIE